MKTPLLNKIIIFLIIGLRPLFGLAHCKYVVSCTQFATEELQQKSLLPAVWAIIKRVCSCNPIF